MKVLVVTASAALIGLSGVSPASRGAHLRLHVSIRWRGPVGVILAFFVCSRAGSWSGF